MLQVERSHPNFSPMQPSNSNRYLNPNQIRGHSPYQQRGAPGQNIGLPNSYQYLNPNTIQSQSTQQGIGYQQPYGAGQLRHMSPQQNRPIGIDLNINVARDQSHSPNAIRYPSRIQQNYPQGFIPQHNNRSPPHFQQASPQRLGGYNLNQQGMIPPQYGGRGYPQYGSIPSNHGGYYNQANSSPMMQNGYQNYGNYQTDPYHMQSNLNNHSFGQNYGQMNSSNISNNYNTTMQEQQVFCVICSNMYTYSQRDEHLAIHRSRGDFGNKKVNYMINDYTVYQEPALRPIVEPQEFNIQYNPNKYILQHDRDYRSQTYARPAVVEQCIGTDEDSLIPLQGMNIRQQQPEAYRQQQPEAYRHQQQPQAYRHQQPSIAYQPETIRLSGGDNEDIQSMRPNHYQDYAHKRRPRNEEVYPRGESQPMVINDSINGNDHRFSRNTLVSDDQSQPRHRNSRNSYLNNRETLQSHNDQNRRSGYRQTSSAHIPRETIRQTDEQHRASVHQDQGFRPTAPTLIKQSNMNHNNSMDNSISFEDIVGEKIRDGKYHPKKQDTLDIIHQ